MQCASVTCPTLQYFPILSHKGQDFFLGGVGELLDIKCVLIFSTTIASNVFILRRTERDMVTNVYWSSCKAPVILAIF